MLRGPHRPPNIAAGTAALYRPYLDKHIIPALGSRKVSTITSADIDKLQSLGRQVNVRRRTGP
jgi:hypothetical protein